MQSIRIDDRKVRLAINEDESRVIEFDPHDIGFVEELYGLIADFERAEKDFEKRLQEIEKNEGVDSYGLPSNIGEGLKLLREICKYLRGRIDQVFGKGASERAFGSSNTLNMFEQFFAGVTPYIQNARAGKIEKYAGNRAQRRAAGKVMK